MHLVIAIPALNEAQTIGEVVSAVRASFGDTPVAPTIVVVDDGSTDDTAVIAERNGAVVVRHSTNRGLANAFRTSLRFALAQKADAMVGMDADGQFRASDIERLIEPITSGEAEFVTGNRFEHGRPSGMPWSKYAGNRLMSALVSRLTGLRFSDVSCGFRAYSREALLQLNVHGSFTYTQETFLDLVEKGVAIREVPVAVTYSAERKSRIARSLVRYGGRTLLTILRTVRDHAPLKVIGIPGALLTLFGTGGGIFVFAHYLLTGAFSPYIFVAFASAYAFTLGLGTLLAAFIADMMRAIRRNQEQVLYFLKRDQAADRPSSEGGEMQVPTARTPVSPARERRR